MAASGRAARVLWIVGVVVGVPLAACAGLAWVGKQVADQEAGALRIATPAEIRAAMHAPPAALLTAARGRLADGYDPATRLGGCLDGATGYLARIPSTAPEAASVPALEQEMDARMIRAGRREAGLARSAAQRPASPGVRHGLAQQMTRDFVGAGFHVGVFTAQGSARDELVFAHARCGRAFLDGLVGDPADRAALRTVGFTRVRCEPGGAVTALTALTDAPLPSSPPSPPSPGSPGAVGP